MAAAEQPSSALTGPIVVQGFVQYLMQGACHASLAYPGACLTLAAFSGVIITQVPRMIRNIPFTFIR